MGRDPTRETLAEFIEEWWTVYAGPNLERATLRAYASFWNSHALPRLGHMQLRELTPQTIARFRADLEAAGVGIEAIRKSMTMLQGVLQRAVEWGRVPTNAVKITRKPPKPHRPAVQAIPPTLIEVMRARLLEQDKRRDATLLAPLHEDLAAWRATQAEPPATAPVFPSHAGTFWRASDCRNWRKRSYKPVAEAVGINGARPYDLRHAFASLLIYEGRLSVVDIAAQLGHNPTVCLDTYAHMMAEQRGAQSVSAEAEIAAACAPSAADELKLSFSGRD